MVPGEDRAAEQAFDPAELGGQRGLRDAERSRGPGHAALVGNGPECPEMSQFELHPAEGITPELCPYGMRLPDLGGR
ncbi:hypothetical protein GCM10010176_041190 [Nonomuraea spiralis]|nr:hypothetical protein GCM10010176_041190 [Nonomuraea spiralis]